MTQTRVSLLFVAALLAHQLDLSAGQSSAFRFESDGGAPTGSEPGGPAALVWQPLRATFRPLNRQSPPPPPPPPPEPLALSSSGEFDFASTTPPATSLSLASTTTTSTATPTTSAPETPANELSATTISPPLGAASNNFEGEEQPTRAPMNRFRPTRPPSVDAPASQAARLVLGPAAGSGSQQRQNNSNNNNTLYRISNDCFECICEASTNCNLNSRCQTSDVRHTRCGMLLISYDQWLESGLSRQLVSREALLKDPAADERAFYECVTQRECAERLMAIYMQRRARDCDKDGRIDCYDVAAIHQGGQDHCNSETLLESQYWSDFNACYGFSR